MTKKIHLDVRRQKVLALLVTGLTYAQIAEELDMHPQAVYRDVKWMRANRRVDIALIRAFNWDKIMALFPKLTPYQEARLRIDIQKILEPRKLEAKVEATGDFNFILEAWRPDGDEEDEDSDDNDVNDDNGE